MTKDRVSSIVRALEILECFMDSTTEWTLKALVDRLQMPSTTVFRQLSTLVERDYLTQDPIRKSYRPGPRLLLLSSSILSQSDLRSIARPELEKLSATVKETINLSMLIDHDIFYLDKVETFRSVACNTKIGTRATAHATSAGKIMLAYQSEAVVEKYCQALSTMPPLTGRTISSPDDLRAELVRDRLRGYALDDEEIEPGLTCVGAPIFDMNHRAIAAVSIAGPSFRMQKELDSMIREARQTSDNISRLLGGKLRG